MQAADEALKKTREMKKKMRQLPKRSILSEINDLNKVGRKTKAEPWFLAEWEVPLAKKFKMDDNKPAKPVKAEKIVTDKVTASEKSKKIVPLKALTEKAEKSVPLTVAIEKTEKIVSLKAAVEKTKIKKPATKKFIPPIKGQMKITAFLRV